MPDLIPVEAIDLTTGRRIPATLSRRGGGKSNARRRVRASLASAGAMESRDGTDPRVRARHAPSGRVSLLVRSEDGAAALAILSRAARALERSPSAAGSAILAGFAGLFVGGLRRRLR